MAQPQDVSYFTHGQPLVRHRDALPKYRENPTAVGCPASLSSGAQTSCTVPVRTAKAISFRPESPITLRRNRRSLSAGMTDHFALECDHFRPESARTVRAARDSGPRVDRSASRTHRRAGRRAKKCPTDLLLACHGEVLAEPPRGRSRKCVHVHCPVELCYGRNRDHGLALGGQCDLERYIATREYGWTRPSKRAAIRDAERAMDGSAPHCTGRNESYVVVMGLRADEIQRVDRIVDRSARAWELGERITRGSRRPAWIADMRPCDCTDCRTWRRAARTESYPECVIREATHPRPRRDQCAAQSADDRGFPYAHQGSYRLRRNGMRSNAQVRVKRSTTHLRKTPRTGCETPRQPAAQTLRERARPAHEAPDGRRVHRAKREREERGLTGSERWCSEWIAWLRNRVNQLDIYIPLEIYQDFKRLVRFRYP